MLSEVTDYIVVGAGLTGCVIAHKLAIAGFQVLILEAGQDPSANSNVDVTTLIGGFELLGTELDWSYQTIPQRNTHNRSHTINSGKGLGGGTTINYGSWLRGDVSDFNVWAELVNDQRWSYEGLLPWFRKSESYFDQSACKRQHGFQGPIHVTSISGSDPDRRYPLRDRICEAWSELGVELTLEDKGSISGLTEIHENSKDGKRQPAHVAYSLNTLRNVRVLTGAMAARILFTDGVHTSGIELIDGRCFKARREVILCAGAIRTPQILMLSGIGPAKTLAAQKISVRRDVPMVGENLHDHFALFMAFRLKDPERVLALGKLNNPAFFSGLPYDWVVNETEKHPDLEREIVEEAANPANVFAKSLLTHPRPLVENFSIYAPAGIPGVPNDGTHIASSTMLQTPTSRGTVSIASPSATDSPIIDSRFLSTAVDRTALIHACRRMLKAMLGTRAMQSFIAAETPPLGGPGMEGLRPLTSDATDAEILDRIQRAGSLHHHSGGTAAMGSVVDPEGRVIGTKGLRVADASIIPIPIAGHPQATLYAMAEQLAAMIAEAA